MARKPTPKQKPAARSAARPIGKSAGKSASRKRGSNPGPQPRPKIGPKPRIGRPPKSLAHPSSDDSGTKTGRKAGENMLAALGGKASVISILSDSDHPKAQLLIDRLQSSVHDGERFAVSYSSVGLKAIDVLDIFSTVQQAKIFIQALSEGDEVMRSLIRAAKDQIEPHDRCDVSGWIVDRKTGAQVECKPCRGSGYVLVSGERDAQNLYFELLSWKKSGGMIQIDNRRQTVNMGGNGGNGLTGGYLPGQVPEVLSLIKKADKVLLPPVAASSEPTTVSETTVSVSVMPEDVLEAEPV